MPGKRLPCGHLSENEKDWGNPAFGRIYAFLAMADRQEPGDEIPNWLNANGFANLTCCPECHVDDFVHVVGCGISKSLDAAALIFEAAAVEPASDGETGSLQPQKESK